MRQEQTNTAAAQTDGHVIHWAGFYDSLVRVIALGREGEMRRQTIALAELQPDQQVLDVGCGTGTLAIAAAQAEPTAIVHGIDPAPEMVQRARRKAAAAGVEAVFDVGVIEQLDLEADTFDVVLSSLMLHHLPEKTRRTGLGEILRVLKPGGRLVAVDFPGPGPMLHRLGNLLRRGTAPSKRHVDQVLDEVRDVGFGDVVRGRLRPGLLFSLVACKPT